MAQARVKEMGPWLGSETARLREGAESDVWLFSPETLALVDALVEARLQGLYPDGELRRATRENTH